MLLDDGLEFRTIRRTHLGSRTTALLAVGALQSFADLVLFCGHSVHIIPDLSLKVPRRWPNLLRVGSRRTETPRRSTGMARIMMASASSLMA